MNLRVLMPVYNDWQSAERLLRDLDRTAAAGLRLAATLVDDGSTEKPAWPDAFRPALERFDAIEILELRANRGQSFAVAVGLAHLLSQGAEEPLLMMDADGEDRASDVPALVEAFRQDPRRMVLAARRRRSENIRFRLSYLCFQGVFRALVGRSFRIGLFGIYPMAQIDALSRIPGFRRNVPGTVIASGLAERYVPIDRGKRYFGRSRFGLKGHLRHAWGILAANRTRIMKRLAWASGALSAVFLTATAVHASVGSGTWVTAGLLAAVASGLVALGLVLLRSRTRGGILPNPRALLADHVTTIRPIGAASPVRSAE